MEGLPPIEPFLERLDTLSKKMESPDFYNDQRAASQASRECRQLEKLRDMYRSLEKTHAQIQENKDIISENSDPELVELAKEDLTELEAASQTQKNEILKLYPDAKIIRRGECWAKLCENRRLTAVVGSHGKSTVSAMIAHASLKLNLDCGFLIGAVPNDFPMHRYCPEGEIVVSEIDESDGTIENFHPEVLVALNADLDHTDTYADYARLEDMFARIFARTKRKILYPARDKTLERIAGKYAARSRAVETPQDFMGANAAMALAALEETFGKKFCPSVFESYKGLLRRQEILCDGAEIFAMADYAHHPTEIKSFIEWFLGRHPENPLIFFQPHHVAANRLYDLFAA